MKYCVIPEQVICAFQKAPELYLRLFYSLLLCVCACVLCIKHQGSNIIQAPFKWRKSHFQVITTIRRSVTISKNIIPNRELKLL